MEYGLHLNLADINWCWPAMWVWRVEQSSSRSKVFWRFVSPLSQHCVASFPPAFASRSQSFFHNILLQLLEFS